MVESLVAIGVKVVPLTRVLILVLSVVELVRLQLVKGVGDLASRSVTTCPGLKLDDESDVSLGGHCHLAVVVAC